MQQEECKDPWTRGHDALDDRQIEKCRLIREVLRGHEVCEIDFMEAKSRYSQTRFNEAQNRVFVGSNVVPGVALDAETRMSEMACLAHELAHAQRFSYGISRPTERPDSLRDEAEASLHASWYLPLGPNDRVCLVEDARDQLQRWLSETDGGE